MPRCETCNTAKVLLTINNPFRYLVMDEPITREYGCPQCFAKEIKHLYEPRRLDDIKNKNLKICKLETLEWELVATQRTPRVKREGSK